MRRTGPAVLIVLLALAGVVYAETESPPKLIITRTLDPDEVEIGQTVKVTITIKNTGNGTAKNIMLDEGTIANTYKDGCPSSIEDMAAGKTLRIDYDLKVGDNVQPGTYELPAVVLNYKSEPGNSYSSESRSSVLKMLEEAPIPSVRIISTPSTIHGGEDAEIHVGWENIPPNWKLVASIEKSDTDKDRLADDVERTISGTGEAVFKLNAYQIDETYDRALAWAALRDENDNWKGIYTNAGTTVLPAATRAPQIATTPEPSPVRTPALVDRISTPTPTPKKYDDTTPMLKLAGGAIIALIAIVFLETF